MKLRAVRLAEIGPFFDGVALSDISDGLNVLVGPNERGKSTVLRALNVLFGEPHTAQKQSIKNFRSYRGGAPLIEAEFEMVGQAWWLRKRYLAGKSAELVALGSGETWRNADAEEKLSGLLEEHTAVAGARGFLWVEQTKSFAVPVGKESDQLGGALAVFIKREAASVTGGDMLARVKALNSEALGGLVTGVRKTPKKGGALADAIRDRDRFAGEREASRAALAQTEERARELAALRAREDVLQSPDRKVEMATAIEAAQQELEAGRLARERLAAMGYKVQAAQSAFDAKAAEAKAEGDKARELVRLEAVLAELKSQHEVSETELKSAEEALQAAAAQVTGLQGRLGAAQGDVQRLEVAERLAGLQKSHDDLERRVKGADAAARRASEIKDRLASITITPEDVARVRRFDGEIGELTAVRAAAAAAVSVSYQTGVAGGFEVDGKALQNGARVAVEQPIEVCVPGVGALTIAPGRSGELAEWDARLTVLGNERAGFISQMKVADLVAGELVLQGRADMQRDLQAADAEVAALAPEGIEALRLQLQAIGQDIAGGGLPDAGAVNLEDGTQLRALVAGLTGELVKSRAAFEKSKERVQAMRLKVQGTALQIENSETQKQTLAAALPGKDQRDAFLTKLSSDRDALQEALFGAVREQDAWQAKAPADDVFAALSQKVAGFEDNMRREREELQDIWLQISGVEGRMEELRERDVRARCEELTEAHAQATARVEEFETEVAALALIDQELMRTEAALQERVLAPLMERLAPLVSGVLDGATLHLDGPLEVTEIKRGAQMEAVDDLSDGTREQIAVMVRLAYARMFADLGVPVPVILDDALVFSDDRRLRNMFNVLQDAGRRHQVLVLTCHDRGFSPLVTEFGAQPLELVAWDGVPMSKAV